MQLIHPHSTVMLHSILARFFGCALTRDYIVGLLAKQEWWVLDEFFFCLFVFAMVIWKKPRSAKEV